MFLCILIMTYVHTCMRASIHAYIHTYIHLSMNAYIHRCMHPCIHAYMHTYRHIDINTYVRKHVRTHVRTYVQTYKQTCMHACIHTYNHTICGWLCNYISIYTYWSWHLEICTLQYTSCYTCAYISNIEICTYKPAGLSIWSLYMHLYLLWQLSSELRPRKLHTNVATSPKTNTNQQQLEIVWIEP